MATLFYNSLPEKLVKGMENEYSFIHDLYKIVLTSLWPLQIFMDMNHHTS